MPGTLKIHSNRGGGDQAFGHSWLEYCPIDGTPTTYGTWGNNPLRQGNGLFENIEQGLRSDACRVQILDARQEERLFRKIDEYRARGTRAWSLFSPCSTFAAEAWEHATGERLQHHTAGISNPTRLAASIVAMNELDLDPHRSLGQAQPRYPGKEAASPGREPTQQGTRAHQKRSKGWSR